MADREKVIQELVDSLKNQHCGFIDGVGDVYAVSEETIKNIITLLNEKGIVKPVEIVLYRKLIRPIQCYLGYNYEPLTKPVEKEEKWYPEEERELLEKKYSYLNDMHFSHLVFDEKYEPYA